MSEYLACRKICAALLKKCPRECGLLQRISSHRTRSHAQPVKTNNPMNTSLRSAKIIGSGSLLTLVLSFIVPLHAGPSPQYWQMMEQIRAENKAKAVNSADTPSNLAAPLMPCEACKTVTLRDSRWVGPPSKGRLEWFTVGAKHTCAHCGGEIKVVRGITTNSMQHNCPMCKDAVRCSVAVQTPAVKT